MKKLFLGLKFLAAVAILWVLLRKSQLQLGLLATILANPFPVFLIILLCYVMVITHAWRWYRFNWVQGIDLSFLRTISPTYLGVAFNTVLPGSVGGDLVRLYYVLKNFPQQKSKAAIAIVVDRISGLMGVFIIACAISPYYLDVFRHDSALYFLLLICVGVCVGSIIVGGGLLILSSEKVGFRDWLSEKLMYTRCAKLLVTLLEIVNDYKNAKLIFLESLLVSMMTQFLLLAVVMILSNVMGLPPLTGLDYMLALVIGQVANLVPLTPGGVGIGEAAFANIILIIHPGATAAYATVFFALRLISTVAYLPGVLIGIFGLQLLNKKALVT